MALKLNSKVLVPSKPPDPDENTGRNSENMAGAGGDFRKHLYNQTAVSGW